MTCFGLLVVFWCEAAQAQVPVDSFCQLYKPVYLSHADTRGTKAATDLNNIQWKAICATK